MKLTRLLLALPIGATLALHPWLAWADESASVSMGEAAQAYAAGAIQKSTPQDGIVNLITGDNQTNGNRMLLGKLDQLYLKLDHPADVAVGDLFTIYRRVRKVFHPSTREYLGFVTIRLAIVKVVQVDPDLTTVQAIRSYGTISPGDPVMRFSPPLAAEASQPAESNETSGMIVELQADKTMTLVAQGDVAYVDRGKDDGVMPGDVMDIYRRSPGLPARKIGQLKILSTEDRTASAKIVKANTRVITGDTFKFTGVSSPSSRPVEPQSSHAVSAKAEGVPEPVPAGLVASKLQVQDEAGQSRINLGDLANLLRYDSGEAAMKPESYKVLDQLIAYLQTSGDHRLVRVEGHTDNVEIGPTLKSRYPSNYDLSKARASGVVRYLVEKGGLDSARLSSVGYGDTRPTATNGNEEGRTKNRRVEILLHAPQPEPQASQGTPVQIQPTPLPSDLSARDTGPQDAPEAPLPDAEGTGTLSVGKPDPISGEEGPAVKATAGGQEQPGPGPTVTQDPVSPGAAPLQ